MAARRRRGSAAAVALTAALGVGSALLLSACGPEVPAPGATATASGPTAAGSAVPGSATPSAGHSGTPGKSPAPVPAHGTGVPHLTVSNGTSQVLLDNSTVDFHTAVRDLAWSPDGSKAAFIDGAGNLVVSNPDGTGKVVAAKNPGGQTWSHPTWQVTHEDTVNHVPVKNNLFFVVDQGGATRLVAVPANGSNSTPAPLSLYREADDNPTPLPQTGNVWPNASGKVGAAVYANTGDGKVYIRDDYLRQQGGELTQGSQPALGPDELSVVFVRSVGGHDHLFEWQRGTDKPTVKDLTPNATTDYTEPAWSPDGKQLAARTPNGIVTLPADGSAAPKPTAATPGLPAYRP
ncbi:TolB family protein [Kitasatospora azatica]|uniref:TolB family protein n=1 Tax=Kitasatospora azatica TaxID=58347 RepID=UPI00055D70AC|nr:PD40 domain-containing protein [Kitasatospora azatica]